MLGVGIRIAALIALHDQTFIPDHLHHVELSKLAVKDGPLALYDARPGPEYRVYSGTNAHAARMLVPQPPIREGDQPRVVLRTAPSGEPLAISVPAGHGDYVYALYTGAPLNHPPADAYLSWLLGLAHRKLDARQDADSRLAHFVFAAPAIIGDLVLALLVAQSLRTVAGTLTPAWGLALTLFCPALIWDSAVRLQTDSVVMAFIVGTFLLLTSGRLFLASAVCGTGLMVRPEVAWAVPLVVYLIARRRSLRTFVLGGLAGLAPVFVVSLPFLLTTGLLWFKAAYVGNVSLYPRLTMAAYNPWWIVAGVRLALQAGPRSQMSAGLGPAPLKSALLADNVPWCWGLTPRTIGGIALGGACLVIVAAVRRYSRGRNPNAFVLGYFVYLAAFLFPTAVHERYILYVLPLAIVAAAQLRSLRAGLWALNVVAFVNLAGYALFAFPSARSGIGAMHGLMIATVLMVVATTVLLFAIPLLEMWRVRPADAMRASESFERSAYLRADASR